MNNLIKGLVVLTGALVGTLVATNLISKATKKDDEEDSKSVIDVIEEEVEEYMAAKNETKNAAKAADKSVEKLKVTKEIMETVKDSVKDSEIRKVGGKVITGFGATVVTAGLGIALLGGGIMIFGKIVGSSGDVGIAPKAALIETIANIATPSDG